VVIPLAIVFSLEAVLAVRRRQCRWGRRP
jgi:hypothetical protein